MCVCVGGVRMWEFESMKGGCLSLPVGTAFHELLILKKTERERGVRACVVVCVWCVHVEVGMWVHA